MVTTTAGEAVVTGEVAARPAVASMVMANEATAMADEVRAVGTAAAALATVPVSIVAARQRWQGRLRRPLPPGDVACTGRRDHHVQKPESRVTSKRFARPGRASVSMHNEAHSCKSEHVTLPLRVTSSDRTGDARMYVCMHVF